MRPIYKVRGVLLLALLILLPLHAFLITWLRTVSYGTPLLMVASSWKELLMVSILGLCILELILERHRPKLDSIDVLVLIYTGVALIWLTARPGSVGQWLLGFRFDVLPFLFFTVLRRVTWNTELIIKTLLISGSALLVFGILQATVLPRELLLYFGYSDFHGGYEPALPITACQYLEGTDSVCRAISTFGGPTRYGSYLLILAGIGLPFLYTLWKSSYKKVLPLIALISFFVLITINVALTYSRSIWLGGIVMVTALILSNIPRLWRRVLVVGGAIAVMGGVFILTQTSILEKYPTLHTLIVRSNSTSEHRAFFEAGVEAIKNHPLGMGLGTVGPASLRYEKFLTENWYLQVAAEMGVIGVLIYLVLITTMAKSLAAKKNEQQESTHFHSLLSYGLFVSLIGMCTAALLTHAFEEMASTLTFFAFAAMALPVKQGSHKDRA